MNSRRRKKIGVVSLKPNNYDPTSINLVSLLLENIHKHTYKMKKENKKNVVNVATLMTDIFIFLVNSMRKKTCTQDAITIAHGEEDE